MESENLIDWADSQPVWIQVIIGMTLFFVLLPSCLMLLNYFLLAIVQFFSKPITIEADSKEHENRIDISDEELVGLLTEYFKGRLTSEQIEYQVSDMSEATKYSYQQKALNRSHLTQRQNQKGKSATENGDPNSEVVKHNQQINNGQG